MRAVLVWTSRDESRDPWTSKSLRAIRWERAFLRQDRSRKLSYMRKFALQSARHVEILAEFLPVTPNQQASLRFREFSHIES